MGEKNVNELIPNLAVKISTSCNRSRAEKAGFGRRNLIIPVEIPSDGVWAI